MPQAKEPRIEVAIDWFQMNPNGIEVSNPHVAAALLCRSQYWGNSGEARRVGPQGEFPPAAIKALDVRFHPKKNKLYVIFIIQGDPAELRIRRARFHAGELFIEKPEWRKHFQEVTNIVSEKKEKATKRMRELIAGGAL